MSQPSTEIDRPKAAPKPSPQAPNSAPKKRNRRAVVWALLVIAVVGAATFYFYHRNVAAVGAPRLAGSGRFRGGFGGPVPVVVDTARKRDVNLILNGLGTVTPLATVTVRTQISGYLSAIKFTEDQLVKRGDVLAVIDERPYRVALEQAQGQLAQAQAQNQEAQIDLERYTTLSTQDSISKQQVDAQRALVAQDAGLVKVDEAAVDSAQLNLAYCQVAAPVDGRVGLRQVDVGNYVTPADANGLVVLTQVQPMSVIFTLPEDNIPQVVKRVRANAKIPVTAYNRDNTAKLAVGTLATIDNAVDPTTGTFKLRAMFDNKDEALFPDQFVNVSMLIDVDKDALVVPTSAIERGQQGSFVYVVGADNKVTAQNVTLGPVEGERQEILTTDAEGHKVSDVAENDKVVVDGADRLKDGMEVKPSEADHSNKKGTHGAGGHGAGSGGGHHWNPNGGGSWSGGSGGSSSGSGGSAPGSGGSGSGNRSGGN